MRRKFSNNRKEPAYTDKYLTIYALEDGLTASLSENNCEYCINGDDNWITLTANTTTQPINSGQTLSFRGNLTPEASTGIGTFTISKKCNIIGNCMSMLFGDNALDENSLIEYPNAFTKLFYNNTNIISVSENLLPATTLANSCYYNMFYGCTSLTSAPKLPATTLTRWCYGYMFDKCTSLTAAPELPATILANYCYYSMFQNCTSLTTAPELPATTLADECYGYMFYKCTSLTAAPELPATILVAECYGYMFCYCTSLTYIKMLATDISATYCLYRWVDSVSSTGTFVKNKDATWDVVGRSGIPEGWTVVTE